MNPLDPLRISAQFAAYVWYTNRVAAGQEPEAAAFAKVNWPSFLPLAHKGLGRLLGRIIHRDSSKLQEYFRPKLAKLKTLAGAFHGSHWPQSR
jgi:hypothetical protein